MSKERRAAVLLTESRGRAHYNNLKKTAMKIAKDDYYPTGNPVEIEVFFRYVIGSRVSLFEILSDAVRVVNETLIVDEQQIVRLAIAAKVGIKQRTIVTCTELDAREVAS